MNAINTYTVKGIISGIKPSFIQINKFNKIIQNDAIKLAYGFIKNPAIIIGKDKTRRDLPKTNS